ncbi:MAG: 16S rRNA (guanine(527)-N(7))-methyltransferase RsmG [Bacteroidota bacterium]
MQQLLSYFPNLTETQQQQFAQLEGLYQDWNQKINVISRKDIDNLYIRHVLHSLSVPPVVRFRSGADILDLGTGGGFPGIPLAIFYPEVNFTLIDGTRKKITVVQEVAAAVGLKNVQAQQIRAEELKGKFDFVVTRAVARLDKLIPWSQRLIKNTERHAIPNGILALKGGNIKAEIREIPKGNYVEVYPINDFFAEEEFAEKYVVYVQR